MEYYLIEDNEAEHSAKVVKNHLDSLVKMKELNLKYADVLWKAVESALSDAYNAGYANAEYDTAENTF